MPEDCFGGGARLVGETSRMSKERARMKKLASSSVVLVLLMVLIGAVLVVDAQAREGTPEEALAEGARQLGLEELRARVRRIEKALEGSGEKRPSGARLDVTSLGVDFETLAGARRDLQALAVGTEEKRSLLRRLAMVEERLMGELGEEISADGESGRAARSRASMSGAERGRRPTGVGPQSPEDEGLWRSRHREREDARQNRAAADAAGRFPGRSAKGQKKSDERTRLGHQPSAIDSAGGSVQGSRIGDSRADGTRKSFVVGSEDLAHLQHEARRIQSRIRERLDRLRGEGSELVADRRTRRGRTEELHRIGEEIQLLFAGIPEIDSREAWLTAKRELDVLRERFENALGALEGAGAMSVDSVALGGEVAAPRGRKRLKAQQVYRSSPTRDGAAEAPNNENGAWREVEMVRSDERFAQHDEGSSLEIRGVRRLEGLRQRLEMLERRISVLPTGEEAQFVTSGQEIQARRQISRRHGEASELLERVASESLAGREGRLDSQLFELRERLEELHRAVRAFEDRFGDTTSAVGTEVVAASGSTEPGEPGSSRMGVVNGVSGSVSRDVAPAGSQGSCRECCE